MFKRLCLFVAAIFFSVTIFCQKGNINGYVFDGSNLKAIGNAIVGIRLLKEKAFTNEAGYFKFDSLPAGKHKLEVFSLPYATKNIVIDVIRDSTVNINIQLGEPCSYDLHSNNDTCPVCKTNKSVIPIVYGLPMKQRKINGKEKENYFAGCEPPTCRPHWYCKLNNHQF